MTSRRSEIYACRRVSTLFLPLEAAFTLRAPRLPVRWKNTRPDPRPGLSLRLEMKFFGANSGSWVTWLFQILLTLKIDG